MTAAGGPAVVRSGQRLHADPSRVIARLFVPGHEGFDHGESRVTPVTERVLDLDEPTVLRVLDDVMTRCGSRHRDLAGTFRRHAEEFRTRLDPTGALSPAHTLLLGATFTSEFAIEGAALCNPSIVAHPDQAGAPPGGLNLVMSVRAIGEGHRSSIGFRTGVVDAAGSVVVDPPSRFATTGRLHTSEMDAEAFRGALAGSKGSGEDAEFVLGALGPRFGAAELDQQLERLHTELPTRRRGQRTIEVLRKVASRCYGVHFDPDTTLSERVLWPATHVEAHGMEDARFVRFVDDDGSVTYRATYTAYDGIEIRQQLLETTDFVAFTSSPLVGPAAANKGLALFPRRIAGRFVALSRSDRETNSIAFSDSVTSWGPVHECQVPTEPWELLQLGNCGSPIETEAGWLVLTHGVGPMRTYSIGAVLLDLDEPTRVIGRLPEPLLVAAPDEQDGYVPNVVYSCGALVHAGTLVLPYGIGDAAIGVATVPVDELLGCLAAVPA